MLSLFFRGSRLKRYKASKAGRGLCHKGIYLYIVFSMVTAAVYHASEGFLECTNLKVGIAWR